MAGNNLKDSKSDVQQGQGALVIGTPGAKNATKVLFLGAGELGKEVAIELQRFGVEVIAVDRYANAPAMQVSHRFHVIDMLDAQMLRKVIELEAPDFIVPEIEAIATAELVKLEAEGYRVVPSANAVHLTMNREGIRRLVAEELGIKTSPYCFADSYESFLAAVNLVGFPCIVKPIMSSSGKGQSLIRDRESTETAWKYAQEGGRSGKGKVIVEGFVNFDYEITLLTCVHSAGVSFCEPIGHVQVDGDYRESWQPQPMDIDVLESAKTIAKEVTAALQGFGVFGVELFIKGKEVYFSEVSPRPHDTGLVTLISQDLSEFSMHARALLGIPVVNVAQKGPSASAVILAEGVSRNLSYAGVSELLNSKGIDIRLFGKPEINGKRRLGVVLAKSESIKDAREKACDGVSVISVRMD
ncbi:MAG: formate-dependent phosphoribosylglycinamide formyltransferase [Hahellaceae bacterium]|nr:formate-dependent phosphoribosylglycinamide formyltransferase [Hahellaceae bacterium]MCP5212837.1 formate-dependent phosphoribosylglycinamide formyltransferase [Hahellaceae bacterium]